MKRMFWAILVSLAMCCVGCSSKYQITNVEGLIPSGMTKEQVQNSIIYSLEKRNWTWDIYGEDNIRASTIAKKVYPLVVDVNYSKPHKYEIRYVSSSGNAENGKAKIGKIYHKMMLNLKKTIDKEFSSYIKAR
ncbi:MAG: hypothetical protein ACI4NE_01625 [Succinivibrio sp.]